MISKKSQRSELLTALGVGILIEGLIAFAMIYIGPTWRAIGLFLVMFIISLFLGCFAYMVSLGRLKRNREARERS